MLELHRTNGGQEIVVSSMEDSHLINTVNMHLKKIDDAKQMLSANVGNSFQAVLYDVDYAKIMRKAKKQIQACTAKLYPYLAECMLRGINLTAELQKTFERSEKDKIMGATALMINGDSDYEMVQDAIDEFEEDRIQRMEEGYKY